MVGSIREMSSEMGDNHGNFDLFRFVSSVRRKTRKCADVTLNRIEMKYFFRSNIYFKNYFRCEFFAILNILKVVHPEKLGTRQK